MISLAKLRNRSMAEKLKAGEAIDVSKHRIMGTGRYVLPEFVEDVDYCDAEEEAWIWSIGRELATGQIIASRQPDLYQNQLFECLFLR